MNNVMLLGILFHKLSPTVFTDTNGMFSWLIIRLPFPVDYLSSTALAMLFKAKHWIQVPLSCQLNASLIIHYCSLIYCVDKWVIDKVFLSSYKDLVNIFKNTQMFEYSYISTLFGGLWQTIKLEFCVLANIFFSKLGENSMWSYFSTYMFSIWGIIRNCLYKQFWKTNR